MLPEKFDARHLNPHRGEYDSFPKVSPLIPPPDLLTIVAFALLFEAGIGYPTFVYMRIGHPVIWMGQLIEALDRALNKGSWGPSRRRAAGFGALVIILTAVGLPAFLIQAALLEAGKASLLVLALLASTLLAQRSLHEHVAAVSAGLRAEGLTGGRRAVSMIVGRDPESLDEAGVCRAAIESLAENFSDGIVAPAFWLGLGGLSGAALYKAVNTADSMIGHRTERHEDFGWAAARFDDFANLPASRLAALLIVLAAAINARASAAGALRAIRRDARHHRSPNAGWPEAAIAGALGLRLAGPRVYGGALVEDHWMGQGRAEAAPADVDLALALYRQACTLLIGSASTLAAGAWLIAR